MDSNDSPKASSSSNYGPVADKGAAVAQVYDGEEIEPSVAQRNDGLVHYADASGQLVGYGGGTYQLNFENADVSAVCKAILGGILSVNYMIDPKVSGQVSLTSSQPIQKARLLPLLESALSSIGASLVKENGLYHVIPGATAGGFENVDTGADSEGYGTTVIVAKYVSATTIAGVLMQLDSRPGAVQADPATNYVLVRGTTEERKAAIDAASLVDADWLKSKSVAILPVSNSSPKTLISELNRILDTGQGGLSQGIVQLQPMTRLNAVLAVSRRRDAIDQVTKWVARLDRVDPNSGVKMYRLQYAKAKDVAALINSMYGSGQASTDKSDGNVLEPAGTANQSRGNNGAGGLPQVPANNVDGSADMNTGTSANQSPFGLLKTAFHQSTTSSSKNDSIDTSFSGMPSGASGVHAAADPNSDTLFIKANAEQYKAIERAIHQMDRPPVQVDIEATIAEVTLNKELQYGVQFFLQNHQVALGLTNSTGIVSAATNGLNLLVGAASNPKVLLNALQNYTSVKILSSPSLVVLDRQPAVLQVGDQVPVLTQSAQSVLTSGAPIVSSVDYKDTGIILNVLPRVDANGTVTLDVEQDISSVQNNNSPTLTPTISQRRIRSTVAVANGQTVMLAGLISEQDNSTINGLPGISQIKFLRDILSSHDTTGQRDELIVFIRPKIISSAADAEQVTTEFRNRLLSMQPPISRP
jgi:general secretion pathway protein D